MRRPLFRTLVSSTSRVSRRCCLPRKLLVAWALVLLGWAIPELSAADAPSSTPLTDSFSYGREYFVLRGGRAKMIVQADKAGLGPALMYMLFDAQDSRQTRQKNLALNFGGGQGLVQSALKVRLGGFPFTALAHQTESRWATVDGIPAVEAVWWAGGLRVTERIFALANVGIYVRRIELASVNLGGPEPVTVRLELPPGPCTARDGLLLQDQAKCRLALSVAGEYPSHAIAGQGAFEIGPTTIVPGKSVSFDTLLQATIPPAAESLQRPSASRLRELLTETRAQWSRASSVATADATVQQIFDKARLGLPGMVAENGVMDAGMFEYGAQWVRDSSNTLLGMTHAGQFELAERGFRHILDDMVDAEGKTMISGGFETADREQFDQMGELIHALKAYRDWTGDDSLIRTYRSKLLAMIERPLRPEFRDATGMVHNRREFWERMLDDAYELAYQTYLVVGLRDAAALADALGAPDHAARWNLEAERTRQAMLSHPTRALVAEGRLIKRRSVSGQWVRHIRSFSALADVPLNTEQTHLAEPDATMALPIALGLVDARSKLARNTLDSLEGLSSARWFGGGYERYHSSGQGDQPGPWPFASCFILRAQHEAGLFDRSRRTLEWLNTVQGGRAGAWFEEIPLARSQMATAGILPWTSGEVSLFVVRHVLGVRFDGQTLVLKPSLFPGSPPLTANLRFRKGRLQLEIPGPGAVEYAEVDGQRFDAGPDGAVRLPATFVGGKVVFYVSK